MCLRVCTLHHLTCQNRNCVTISTAGRRFTNLPVNWSNSFLNQMSMSYILDRPDLCKCRVEFIVYSASTQGAALAMSSSITVQISILAHVTNWPVKTGCIMSWHQVLTNQQVRPYRKFKLNLAALLSNKMMGAHEASMKSTTLTYSTWSSKNAAPYLVSGCTNLLKRADFRVIWVTHEVFLRWLIFAIQYFANTAIIQQKRHV